MSCLVLLSVIKYRVRSIGIEKRQWDLMTVTASDYTLELQLSIEQVRGMRKNLKLANFMPNETDGLRLKLWLAKKVEDCLDELSHGHGGKVSAINFTFHNSWVLDMLREKGDYIKWQEWKKLNMLNRVLTKRIKENLADARNQEYEHSDFDDKTDYKKSICDPITAFVSMETEEAYNNLASVPEIMLGGIPS